ncbi:MAG: helix-turn-helix domain-containing protein [Cryomorphaceae bacterium]|nr:helix-turn-helix transcriptional regulator [Flavobacteriales bacterium]
MKKKEVGLKAMYDDLVSSLSEADHLEIEAGVLALNFIAILDEAMEAQDISKKELAKRIGTSPSFITQVFRGNRKPNWEFLAKAQRALGVRFEISTKEKLNEWLEDEIHEYHRRWRSSRKLFASDYLSIQQELPIINEEHDYALAG